MGWLKCGLALAFAGAMYGAEAATITRQGVLANDDGFGEYKLLLTRADTVHFRTFSYAGGTLSDGSVDAGGGFDPVVSVFDALGHAVATEDDGAVRRDSQTGEALDAAFSLDLSPGFYLIFVKQFPGFALGDLADGFAEVDTSQFGCSNGIFCDLTGANRDGHWSLDIRVPAPPVVGLMALALLLTRLSRRR